MLTAEELENCDIFPKKITLLGVIKFLVYFTIMFLAIIFILSIYTGREMKYILSMDSIKYSAHNDFSDKLYLIDSRFNYNLQDKYTFESQNNEEYFMREYVSQSIPCILKNFSQELPFFEKWNVTSTHKLGLISNFFKEFMLDVEIKAEPKASYFYGDYKIEKMKYLDFFEKATNKQRNKNYFLNSIVLPDYLKNQLVEIEIFNLTKHLKFEHLKYSEGFSENILPSHYEKKEQILCMFSGSIDIIVIPHLYRATVYSYKKGYGPQNYSPIDFFQNEFGRFPKFSKSHRLLITLNQGDCLYLPSFWWFSIKSQINLHYQIFTFTFESSSRMLENLILNIELDEI